MFSRNILRIARRPHHRRTIVLSGATISFGVLALAIPSIHADHHKLDHSPSLPSLIRAYTVYTLCSVPILVDNSPEIFTVLRSIPGIKHLTDAFVRATFFSQFVGGDSAQETVPLLHRLRSQNKGALFAYSIEVDESDPARKRSPSSGHDTHHLKPVHKRVVDEMIRSIDVAADFEDGLSAGTRMTWVAVKMTALLPDPNALIALSAHIIKSRPPEISKGIAFPGCPTVHDLDILNHSRTLAHETTRHHHHLELTQADIKALKELHADLVRIGTRAQERNVRLVVDAEYTWYQPAIDAFTYSLMRQFNKLPSHSEPLDKKSEQDIRPLVYTTFQAYLRRTPAYLLRAIQDAKTNNYALGVKLVRGAYHPHEISAHAQENHNPTLSRSISPDSLPPVWTAKEATDDCFNNSVRLLLRAIKDDDVPSDTHTHSNTNTTKRLPTIGVLFGTHNWASCNLVLDELVSSGLAAYEKGTNVVQLSDDVMERVTVGQLYGMSDALTDYLVGKTSSKSPFVIKYVPYGALSEVMPYLGRRAIENKSVLGTGSATNERRWAWAAIRKKLFGWLA